jgi:hypothetical protein
MSGQTGGYNSPSLLIRSLVLGVATWFLKMAK